jgi:hypothetical protein
VGKGLHHWHLPGGSPPSPIKKTFEELFGSNVFDLAQSSPLLFIRALDLAAPCQEKSATSFIALDSPIEEVREKLTGEKLFVSLQGTEDLLGAISKEALEPSTLGSVTLRDFCNEDEIKIPPYLQIASVVDHHKSALKTTQVATVSIGDAQSCNVLIAEHMFSINDRYSTATEGKDETEANLLNRLQLEKRALIKRIAQASKGPYFIHPAREFLEYLLFIYAILDDTDLLSKVSKRDIDCVEELINRMKSLATGHERMAISLQEIKKDASYAKKSARCILQNEEMHSLYSKIYAFKERELIYDLQKELLGQPSQIFADTKEQNQCCRVGQTKLFPSTLPEFANNSLALRKRFLERALSRQQEEPQIDLHLHMISTISGAQEVYQGDEAHYTHQDELWLWTPNTQAGRQHLAFFLKGFQQTKELKQPLSLELVDDQDNALEELFKTHFCPILIQKASLGGSSHAILRVPAGTLNSRKSAISPYLPKSA